MGAEVTEGSKKTWQEGNVRNLHANFERAHQEVCWTLQEHMFPVLKWDDPKNTMRCSPPGTILWIYSPHRSAEWRKHTSVNKIGLHSFCSFIGVCAAWLTRIVICKKEWLMQYFWYVKNKHITRSSRINETPGVFWLILKKFDWDRNGDEIERKWMQSTPNHLHPLLGTFSSYLSVSLIETNYFSWSCSFHAVWFENCRRSRKK